MYATIQILIAISTMIVMFVFYTRRIKYLKKFAPSLPWLPVIGSLPFLTDFTMLHLCFTEKAKRYGKIYALYSGNRYTVVLNGYEMIREALVKHSADFGGREKVYAEHAVWNPTLQGMAFRRYSADFKFIRKTSVAILKQIGMGERSSMETKIHKEITECIKYIREKEGKAFDMTYILRMLVLNIIYNLMLGKRIELNDPIGKYLSEGVNFYLETLHPMLNIFPMVRFLPAFQKILKNIVPRASKWKEFISQEIEDSLDKPSEEEIFVAEFLKHSKEKFDKSELYHIVKEFLAGGMDTTSSQLLWALILLSNHPIIQKRLHKEIDTVVPRERLPSLSDKLPYVEATILELMRLKTSVPLSNYHTTICDTEVAGYFIPNDSQVIVNLWSAHMDPNVWEEPEKFRPERFLNDQGEVINRDRMIAFSLGKRQCPGEVLARFEMSSILAALMQQFEALPPEGQTSIPDHGSVSMVYYPIPFKVRLVPRVA